MKISKFGSIFAFLTGGWSGLATYVLEAVNKWLKTLDPLKLASFSKVVTCISDAISALAPLLPAKYEGAVKVTVVAVDTLAKSLADGEMTQEELDANIDAVESAIIAWKDAAK